MEIFALYKRNPYLHLLTNKIEVNSMPYLLKKTSEFTGISNELILSKSQSREIVDARHLFVKLCFDRGFKHKLIRKFIGKNTHSAIIHSINVINDVKELNDKYKLLQNYLK